jgi:hypothetical protein
MSMHPRTILVVALLAGLTLAPRCATRSSYDAMTQPQPQRLVAQTSSPAPSPSFPKTQAAPAPPSDPFRETIRPILSARCGACHDPGGKMYARLPFDDPKVVSSHSTGVLRRLKGEDRAAMEKWLAGLAPAGAER